MLAMHYAISLKNADQVEAVRIRAAERGPLFDGMAGLRTKLFLVDGEAPCYATFYLWREADAALDFLEGGFFKALCDTFGRPEVKLLLTIATDLPFVRGETLRLQRDIQASEAAPVRTLDPLSGKIVALAPETAKGRRFEVLYRAVGAGK